MSGYPKSIEVQGRDMKTTKFDSWYKEFISSPQGEGAVMALEDLMGDHPEYEDLSA